MGLISLPGKDGSKYVLVATDYFSRFALGKPTPDGTGYDVASTWLRDWSPITGWPEKMYLDNGSYFCNEMVSSMFETRGTSIIYGPVSHPSSTGLMERTVKLIKQQMLRWAADRCGRDLDEWPMHFGDFMMAVNS